MNWLCYVAPVVQILGEAGQPFSGTAFKLSVCEQSAHVRELVNLCRPN